MDYMVVEGGTLTATVRVMPTGVTVATDVRVNVETVPGSATGRTYFITVGAISSLALQLVIIQVWTCS